MRKHTHWLIFCSKDSLIQDWTWRDTMCGKDSSFPDQTVAWKQQQRDFLGLKLYFWKKQYMKWDTQQGTGWVTVRGLQAHPF